MQRETGNEFWKRWRKELAAANPGVISPEYQSDGIWVPNETDRIPTSPHLGNFLNTPLAEQMYSRGSDVYSIMRTAIHGGSF